MNEGVNVCRSVDQLSADVLTDEYFQTDYLMMFMESLSAFDFAVWKLHKNVCALIKEEIYVNN